MDNYVIIKGKLGSGVGLSSVVISSEALVQ